MLKLIKNDPWLKPYAEAIEGRFNYVIHKEALLTNNGKITLSDYASGYTYFGLHKTKREWIFREWAPNAIAIYMVGTFNNWQKLDEYKLHPKANGEWEIRLPLKAIGHGDLFKLIVCWLGLLVWYRTTIPRYSVLKYGIQPFHTYLRRSLSNQQPTLSSSTNAISA